MKHKDGCRSICKNKNKHKKVYTESHPDCDGFFILS